MVQKYGGTTLFLVALLVLAVCTAEARSLLHEISNANHDNSIGTKWAVLVAGSNYWFNYRHQADVCHAYQLLKQGGLKDENIIVFMYDDIAYNKENPRPGVIINSPHGENVYEGVTKDYTGEHCNADNFFAVILGNKTALTGGSGKVVNSGPNDHIFIYYADHGAPGMISMPNDMIFADDLIKVLTKKNLDEAYRKLVFYLEACESGSMFDGLLPKGLNIYVTTASNPYESSWATYCSADGDEGCIGECPPKDFKDVCLGDLYSVSWLEDSDLHNRQVETLEQQYQVVRKRTLNNNTQEGSHVMQYGDLHLSKDALFGYMGSNSSTKNHESRLSSKMINQRDVHLWYLRSKFQSAPEGSARKNEASRQLNEAIAQRKHVDDSVRHIGELLFGVEKGQEVLKTIRPAGESLVDDWDCLKSFVKTFEEHCGKLTPYGRKHVRGFANLCNAGIQREQMDAAAKQACAL